MNAPDTARLLVERGYWVHALCALDEHAHFGRGPDGVNVPLPCASPGKVPILKAWQRDEPAAEDRARIVQEGRGLGVRTGGGLLVVDADVGHDADVDGVRNLAALFAEHGAELPPVTAHTGGGGAHWWFSVADGRPTPRNTSSKLAGGVDTRGDGGQVVAPPSPHRSGNAYRWADGPPPPIGELPPAPDWLLELLRPQVRERSEASRPFTGNDDALTAAVHRALDEHLDPDLPYQDWLNVGQALHAGGYSVELWDDWSARGSKYRAGECGVKWGSFDAARGVTMGTFWSLAKDGGYVPARAPASRPQHRPRSTAPRSDRRPNVRLLRARAERRAAEIEAEVAALFADDDDAPTEGHAAARSNGGLASTPPNDAAAQNGAHTDAPPEAAELDDAQPIAERYAAALELLRQQPNWCAACYWAGKGQAGGRRCPAHELGVA